MASNNDDIIESPPIESGETDDNTQIYNGNNNGQSENPTIVENNNPNTNPGINFVTRILHETDNQVYGVELLLYDDGSDKPIKQILITDENEFNAWVDFIENMKEAYVYGSVSDLNNLTQLRVLKKQLDDGNITETEYEDAKESLEWSNFHNQSLETILENKPMETIEDGKVVMKYPTTINATNFMGMESDAFAKADHSHSYSPFNHKDLNGSYGVADTSNYGHVKIVNNLNNGLDNTGYVLSAYQGYLIGQRLQALEDSKTYSWSNNIKIQSDNANITYSYNEGLKLVALDVSYNNCDKFKNKATTIDIGQIPEGYYPTHITSSPATRGDVVVYVNTKGAIKVRSMSKITSKFNIYTHLLWHYK